MHLMQRQRRINEDEGPHLAARQPEIFDTVGKPLPTSSEDGIPEILAEQRLGHEVPGMRGLYAHTSDRMREDLKRALQARWEDSLRERAARHERSPVPLLNELLAPLRAPAPEAQALGGREKMISQIPPNQAESPSLANRLGAQGKSF